jgi:hypothetical protein
MAITKMRFSVECCSRRRQGKGWQHRKVSNAPLANAMLNMKAKSPLTAAGEPAIGIIAQFSFATTGKPAFL